MIFEKSPIVIPSTKVIDDHLRVNKPYITTRIHHYKFMIGYSGSILVIYQSSAGRVLPR